MKRERDGHEETGQRRYGRKDGEARDKEGDTRRSAVIIPSFITSLLLLPYLICIFLFPCVLSLLFTHATISLYDIACNLPYHLYYPLIRPLSLAFLSLSERQGGEIKIRARRRNKVIG